MATIRERRPGVWEVRAFAGRDDLGRPTQVSRTVRGGKRDALRAAAEMTLQPAPRSGGRTVAELLVAWLDLNQASWAESTKRDQASRAALVTADRIGATAVSRLSVADVDRWHAQLRKTGVGESSIRNQHLVLRAALTQAVRWGWVTTNVASIARLGRRTQAPRAGMRAEDVRAVLAAAEQVEPAAVLALRLAAITGARRSELAALRWEDLDGDRVTIDSSLAIARHGTPEDRRQPTLIDAPTKTGNRRTVTLDAVTLDALASARRAWGEYGPWVLAAGPRPVNPERVTRWWTRSRGLAGVDGRWRLHDLRHWSATVAIGKGHDIPAVAGRLGHANAAMTLRVYAHALEAADQGIAASLAAELDSLAPR